MIFDASRVIAKIIVTLVLILDFNSSFFFQHPCDVERVQASYEQWQKEHGLNPHPFLIVTGPVDDIAKSCLVVNGIIHEYTDLLKAFDHLFKCCAALRSWSDLSDYAFAYIQEWVYGIQALVSPAFVTKSFVGVRKLEEKLSKVKFN